MTPPLTKELLDEALEAVQIQPTVFPRMHDCRFDGHVMHFGTQRCLYCGKGHYDR